MLPHSHNLAPHPALAPYVKLLWAHAHDFSERPDGFSVTPDSYIELTISVGAGWQFGAHRLAEPQVCVVGLLDQPVKIQAAGPLVTVGARCYAWGFAPLLGVPADTAVRLLPQFQRLAQEIGAALVRGETAAALDLLHGFLIARARHAPPPPTAVQTGAEWIFAQRGAARIADLADICGLSARQVERQFLSAVGVTPKALARKMRFEQALYQLYLTPEISGAELAYSFGFADQAHLIREFRTLSGKTPRELGADLLHRHPRQTLFAATRPR